MDDQQALNLLLSTLSFDWGTALSLVNDTILLYLVFRNYQTNKNLKKKIDAFAGLSKELESIRVENATLVGKVDLLSAMLQTKLSSGDISEEKKTEKFEQKVEETRPQENKIVPFQKESIAATVSEVEEVPNKNPFVLGLKKTRDFFFSKLNSIIGSDAELTEKTFADLEELMITSDLGVKTTVKLLQQLKDAKKENSAPEFNLKDKLKEKLLNILKFGNENKEITPTKINNQPFVILVVGVNGVGKTTTIGKLASRFANQGLKVLLGAADTFRAAAVEQIEVWAERAKVELHSGREDAKPSTVAYEALKKAQDNNFDVVIIDTAGRLHTKVNLMNELVSVLAVIEKLQPGAPHESILVLDAATGQNALEQAREFNQKIKLSGLVITKLDGTPKGGIVIAIKDELGIPIRYVGIGEGVEDLRPFVAEEFIEALFEESNSFNAAVGKSELRAVRRRESIS